MENNPQNQVISEKTITESAKKQALNPEKTSKTTESKGKEDEKPKVQKNNSSVEPRIVLLERYLTKKYDLRINVIESVMESKLKHEKQYSPVKDEAIVCELFEYGFTRFKDELRALMAAKIPEYDPIKEYFDSLPKWDSTTDHIADLASFVQTDDQAWFVRMYRKHLVRIVGQALNMIPFNKHCLTFVGKQNDGKTSFWDFHAPPNLRKFYKKGYDFHSGKEGKISLVQNFLINLDELAQFDKKDLNNEFKSVLSEASVKYRILYKSVETAIPRRASFVASTNQKEFLTDETGNVRWIPFVVKSINHDNGGKNGYEGMINIDQVWGQAYELLKSGFHHQLTSDEQNQQEILNKPFFKLTYEMDIVDAYVVPATKLENGATFMTMASLAAYLSKVQEVKLNAVQLGRALAKSKFEKISSRELGYPCYGFYIKFR